MINEFCLAWEKNKDKLEQHIRNNNQGSYNSYEALVTLLFDLVINPEMNDESFDSEKFDTKDITVLDHGDYQGTLVFILHRDTFQPCVRDYVYTNTDYGSCSGCDTLQGIHQYERGLPNDEQVKDYMTLCLHLLQKTAFMIDPE